jgi:hypothetical protein
MEMSEMAQNDGSQEGRSFHTGKMRNSSVRKMRISMLNLVQLS